MESSDAPFPTGVSRHGRGGSGHVKKWVIGAVAIAAAVTTVVVGTIAEVGDAQAAAPATPCRRCRRPPPGPPRRAPRSALRLRPCSVSPPPRNWPPRLRPSSRRTRRHRRRHRHRPGAGTGIVLTSTGEVLTNYHVIGGLRESAPPTSAPGAGTRHRGRLRRTQDIAVLQWPARPACRPLASDGGHGGTVRVRGGQRRGPRRRARLGVRQRDRR